MMIRAQLCRFAITAEKPEWNESECPIDFNSEETGKADGSNHVLLRCPLLSRLNAQLQAKTRAVLMPFTGGERRVQTAKPSSLFSQLFTVG